MPDPVAAAGAPSPRNSNWVSSRKAISGGIGGIVAYFLIIAAGQLGYPIPAELQGMIPGAITWLIYYVVPASKKDVVRNLDNEIVAMAEADPKSPVSIPGIAQAIGVAKVAADDAKAAAIDPNAGNFHDRASG